MSSEAGLLSRLEIFHGAASNHLARVYARLPEDGAFHAPYGDLSLAGFVRGPECDYARTLPTTTRLVSTGKGDTQLAEAAIPDPCFWSPDVPMRYRAHVELRRGEQVMEGVEREFVLRNFGSRGRSLFLDGRRWVLRGIEADDVPTAELPDWRDAGAALLIRDPSDDLCREATRVGVVLLAFVNGGDKNEVISELRRLARFGSVAVAIVQSAEFPASDLRQAAPNIVMAQDIGRDSPVLIGRNSPYYTFPDADMAFVEVGDSPRFFAARVGESQHPVIAWRRTKGRLSLAKARAACDLLQRDLAPYGDYAGYVV